MNDADLKKMSAVVAQHFGWWKPGQVCHKMAGIACDQFHYQRHPNLASIIVHETHEVPPPDLTQPEWFVELLNALTQKDMGVIMSHDSLALDENDRWTCRLWFRLKGTFVQNCRLWFRLKGTFVQSADMPAEALLRAAYEMVTRSVGSALRR